MTVQFQPHQGAMGTEGKIIADMLRKSGKITVVIPGNHRANLHGETMRGKMIYALLSLDTASFHACYFIVQRVQFRLKGHAEQHVARRSPRQMADKGLIRKKPSVGQHADERFGMFQRRAPEQAEKSSPASVGSPPVRQQSDIFFPRRRFSTSSA